MTATQPLPAGRSGVRRASPAGRRLGYLIGAGINAALLWLALVEPGWRAAPFVTEEATAVIGLLSVAWLAGVVVNVAYLAWDPPGFKRLGDAATAALGTALSVRLLVVFPFDFGSPGWSTIVRVLLVVGAVGSAIAVIVNLVQLVTRPWGHPAAHDDA
jgi:hypothetical protein